MIWLAQLPASSDEGYGWMSGVTDILLALEYRSLYCIYTAGCIPNFALVPYFNTALKSSQAELCLLLLLHLASLDWGGLGGNG